MGGNTSIVNGLAAHNVLRLGLSNNSFWLMPFTLGLTIMPLGVYPSIEASFASADVKANLLSRLGSWQAGVSAL